MRPACGEIRERWYKMSVFLTEEHELMRNIAREFAANEVAPRAIEIDRTDKFPYDLLQRMRELNFLGIAIPEEFGGLGAGLLAECIVIEELSKESPLMGMIIDAHSGMGCTSLLVAGTDEQKQKYLVPAARGELIIAFGLTEASGGSDNQALQTTAVLDGDEWLINGSKSFISLCEVAGTYLITAKTVAPGGKEGISAFIVEKDAPGFTIGKMEDKVCWRGGNTGSLYFRNCRIPKENLLGELNKGLRIFLRGLDEGRVTISSSALGCAAGAFARSVNYAKERIAFGKPIGHNQAIAFYLAEMYSDIEVARNMIYATAAMADQGMPFAKSASSCKLFVSRMVEEVTYKAVQIHGGNGLISDFGIDRYWRDARGYSIGEGTSEILKMVLSREIIA